jgi:hypothetical protein
MLLCYAVGCGCCRAPQCSLLVLHLRVAEATSEHAQCLDWEDEFVVGVGDHAMKC